MSDAEKPRHVIGAPQSASKLVRQMQQQQVPFEDDLPAIVEKIRKINEDANNCVQLLRDFNQKISETISGLAKK